MASISVLKDILKKFTWMTRFEYKMVSKDSTCPKTKDFVSIFLERCRLSF